jgi:hypothetical protein
MVLSNTLLPVRPAQDVRCVGVWNTRGFEDRRHDVDDVVELVAHAAGVLDARRP